MIDLDHLYLSLNGMIVVIGAKQNNNGNSGYTCIYSSSYPLLKPSSKLSVKPSTELSLTPSSKPSGVPSSISLSITPSILPSENTIYISITNICNRNEDMLIIKYKSDWTSHYKNITIGVKKKWGFKSILEIVDFPKSMLSHYSVCLKKKSCHRFRIEDKKIKVLALVGISCSGKVRK